MKRFFCILSIILISCQSDSQKPRITVWYGEEQHFGKLGYPQPWINILGNVNSDQGIAQSVYQINGGKDHFFSMGADGRRLARQGDFNLDIHVDSLQQGENQLTILVTDSLGNQSSTNISLFLHPRQNWALPYRIHWDSVANIQDVALIVDGKWKLTTEGIRTEEPYYDRVIAIGGNSWQNYEVSTSVIFHDFTPPREGPPTFGVSHAAIASRWPGHDLDEHQPHVKWYPLGATSEFRLSTQLDSCRWRIFDGENLYAEDSSSLRSIQLDTKYRMIHQVISINDSTTRYSVKLWEAKRPEPSGWDFVAEEVAENNITSGSALIIAHNTDVTFGDIEVVPVP
ncbi:hypothetical protein WJR50_27085 [Catalinimonas sp. 4WD22]|uniref:hypothetical protein n=1 Tax=Catalinimonas locisalis TaxID=3133978 RepID=UPI0031011B79